MKIVAAIAAAFILFLLLRVFSTRGGRNTSLELAGTDAVPLTEDSIRALLLQGRKIQAIKAYRELHHVDLKDAKEAVERLAKELPTSP
jgi:ribosomal protein L7/L12